MLCTSTYNNLMMTNLMSSSIVPGQFSSGTMGNCWNQNPMAIFRIDNSWSYIEVFRNLSHFFASGCSLRFGCPHSKVTGLEVHWLRDDRHKRPYKLFSLATKWIKASNLYALEVLTLTYLNTLAVNFSTSSSPHCGS